MSYNLLRHFNDSHENLKSKPIRDAGTARQIGGVEQNFENEPKRSQEPVARKINSLP